MGKARQQRAGFYTADRGTDGTVIFAGRLDEVKKQTVCCRLVVVTVVGSISLKPLYLLYFLEKYIVLTTKATEYLKKRIKAEK